MAKKGSRKLNSRGLTPKQEKFCQELVINGKTQQDAYKSVYDCENMTPKSVKECASRNAAIDKVKARLAELQAQVDAGGLATLDQIAADLLQIATDKNRPDTVRLKAYDQLSKLQGGYSQNVNVSATGTLGLSLADKEAVIKSLLG